MRLLSCYLKVIMSFAAAAIPMVTPIQSPPINEANAPNVSGEKQKQSDPILSSRKMADSPVGSLIHSNLSLAILDNHTAPICNSSDSTSTPAAQSVATTQQVLVNENALSGNATAQFDLGQYFEIGNGVTKNDDKAKYWYLKAAEQGHVRAQYCLGLLYFQGR